MDVQLPPEQEKQVNGMAALTGRSVSELVSDVLAGYMNELGDTRAMLYGRYDDIKKGKVKLIDGEEAFARLHERIEARRRPT